MGLKGPSCHRGTLAWCQVKRTTMNLLRSMILLLHPLPRFGDALKTRNGAAAAAAPAQTVPTGTGHSLP